MLKASRKLETDTSVSYTISFQRFAPAMLDHDLSPVSDAQKGAGS